MKIDIFINGKYNTITNLTSQPICCLNGDGKGIKKPCAL